MSNTNTDTTTTSPHNHRKRNTIIAATTAAIILTGGLTWWGITSHQNNQLAQAQETCAQASDRLRVAVNRYNALINGDEYQTAVKVTDKQVEDDKVITALDKDGKDKTPEQVACNVDSKDALERNAERIDRNAEWYESHTKTLSTDVKNVIDARDAKTLKDAQTALAKKITDARKLYESSNNKVQDTKTRDTLKKQIDAADKVKDSKDVKNVKDATGALDKAMTQVNDSVTAKSEADRKTAEEKARKEAEAQAAAAAQAQANAQAQQQYAAPQQSYTPTYTAPQQSYTAPQQSYTPTYTAPQQSTPQQSTPQRPTGGNNSGPISGGHGCGSVCTSTTDTYVR